MTIDHTPPLGRHWEKGPRSGGTNESNSVTSDPSYRPRIYIHAPYKPEASRAATKRIILERIRALGFDPQEFHVSGIARGDAWTFDRAIEVMQQCDGALILALMRWTESDGTKQLPVPSEYSHFEGALALSCKLPTLVVAEEGMQLRGILSQVGGSFVLQLPTNDSDEFARNGLTREPPFERWVERVRERYDVFFGYCSEADTLARNIKKYLVKEAGLRVLDWATDFRPGRTIMEEIARATATCRCGLFLFTKSDPLVESATAKAVPRDNVLLEAGYFMSAHGAARMVVVRETGTKMPADLGGMIYLSIEDRDAWKDTAAKIANSLRAQIAQEQ
jgi:hypothetical protein